MFGRTLHICTSFGIRIGIDLSWIFIALLLSWSLADGVFPNYYPNLSTETYWFMGILGMLGLFICIILHELGHSLVAKYYSLPVSSITLFIFGGIAEIRKNPPSPKIEFFVSIAGPIVSVILALFLYFLTLLGKQNGWPEQVIGITGYLALMNAILVMFNIIPALPLDGGRVLRALLWWLKGDPAWATKIASASGVVFGFALIFLGLLVMLAGDFIGGFWFIIIGFFLQGAAALSRTQFYVGGALKSQNISLFMTPNPITVSPDITIKDFVEQYVYHSFHHLYPVVENDSLIGYISTNEVKMVDKDLWEKTQVKEALVPVSKFPTVTPETNALDALNIMNQDNAPTLMVLDSNKLVGIVTNHSLLKFISLKLELEQH